MRAQEKAIELVDKFEPYVIRYTQGDVVGYLDQETPILEYQKQCALIAIDEIIWLLNNNQIDIDYYQEVKQEINGI